MYINLEHKFIFYGYFDIHKKYYITKQPNTYSTCALTLSCIKSGWQYMYKVENLSIKFRFLSSLKPKEERLYTNCSIHLNPCKTYMHRASYNTMFRASRKLCVKCSKQPWKTKK